MKRRRSLAEATLDELPLTVAVLDGDGTILLTNRSWQQFGSSSGREDADDVGVNYVAAASGTNDEHVSRSVEGLTSVLDGERDSFSMEYPCHSPDERRWFMMRATRFSVDGEVRVTVVHLDITKRKLAELAAEESADELRQEREALEHVLVRIDGLVRDVTDAAVNARSRTDVEKRVCESLAATEPYVLAWIGRVDVTGGRIDLREWVGDDVPLEDRDLRLDSTSNHPAVRAIERGTSVVIDDIERGGEAEQWWPDGAGEKFRSVAAIPISYGDVTYGVLTVFAAGPNAFDGPELPVLESLAGTVSTAINAIEARRLLSTDTVVELELSIGDRSIFVADCSSEFDATLTYRGETPIDGGAVGCFFAIDGRVEGIQDALAAYDDVRSVRLVTERENGLLLDVAVTEGLPMILSERGAAIRRFEASDGVVHLELDVPDSGSARSLYDLLSERYEAVELVRYRERERIARTPRDVADRIESELTDRQLTAIRMAHHAGYYRWPREVSGEELAESMDISRSTFHQHLRSAERYVFEELFESDLSSEGE